MPGGHRLFLIDRKQLRTPGAADGAAEEFAVLGATGNGAPGTQGARQAAAGGRPPPPPTHPRFLSCLPSSPLLLPPPAVYTVTIAAHPRCSCPDAAKGNICKHRLFVMLRVLHLPRVRRGVGGGGGGQGKHWWGRPAHRLPPPAAARCHLLTPAPTSLPPAQDEPLVWQAALLPSEADAVLAGQKSLERSVGGGDVLAGAAVREAYRRASTGGDEGGEQGGGGGPPRALEGDCPVCFDALASGEAVSWCAGCRNNVHRECIGHWLKSQRQRGGDASCPLWCVRA